MKKLFLKTLSDVKTQVCANWATVHFQRNRLWLTSHFYGGPYSDFNSRVINSAIACCTLLSFEHNLVNRLRNRHLDLIFFRKRHNRFARCDSFNHRLRRVAAPARRFDPCLFFRRTNGSAPSVKCTSSPNPPVPPAPRMFQASPPSRCQACLSPQGPCTKAPPSRCRPRRYRQ